MSNGRAWDVLSLGRGFPGRGGPGLLDDLVDRGLEIGGIGPAPSEELAQGGEVGPGQQAGEPGQLVAPAGPS